MHARKLDILPKNRASLWSENRRAWDHSVTGRSNTKAQSTPSRGFKTPADSSSSFGANGWSAGPHLKSLQQTPLIPFQIQQILSNISSSQASQKRIFWSSSQITEKWRFRAPSSKSLDCWVSYLHQKVAKNCSDWWSDCPGSGIASWSVGRMDGLWPAKIMLTRFWSFFSNSTDADRQNLILLGQISGISQLGAAVENELDPKAWSM